MESCMTAVTLNHENGAEPGLEEYREDSSRGGRGRTFLVQSSLYGKLTPDIDTHPQLLLPLVGKYAR